MSMEKKCHLFKVGVCSYLYHLAFLTCWIRRCHCDVILASYGVIVG